jgi:hypothetical protein
MDPTSHQTPSFEMPPVAQQGEEPAAKPEQAPSTESVPAPSAPAPMAPPSMPPVDPALYAQPAPGQPPIAGSTATTPAVADDLDLIEKEWVEKAKAIVTQTRNDPHTQNDQMNRFKADYMKKRYNKDIKLPEGS